MYGRVLGSLDPRRGRPPRDRRGPRGQGPAVAHPHRAPRRRRPRRVRSDPPGGRGRPGSNGRCGASTVNLAPGNLRKEGPGPRSSGRHGGARRDAHRYPRPPRNGSRSPESSPSRASSCPPRACCRWRSPRRAEGSTASSCPSPTLARRPRSTVSRSWGRVTLAEVGGLPQGHMDSPTHLPPPSDRRCRGGDLRRFRRRPGPAPGSAGARGGRGRRATTSCWSVRRARARRCWPAASPRSCPQLTREEALETTQLHSVAGLLAGGDGVLRARPFRAPHHSISQAACSAAAPPSCGPARSRSPTTASCSSMSSRSSGAMRSKGCASRSRTDASW